MSSTLAITNQNIRRLTIVVSVVQAVGHVNACIGALTELLARGHRIIFVLTKIYEGKAAKHGYEEHVFQMNVDNKKEEVQQHSKEDQPLLNPGQLLGKLLLDNRIIGSYSPREKMQNMLKLFHGPARSDDFRSYNQELKRTIDMYKPNLFIVEGSILPSIYYSGIPWILINSAQPLFYKFDPDLQPGGGGE